MTSAFIIQVQPHLQSDPNEETAALLRVLIYKIDNTTFGNNIPPIPQWSGPPHMIVQVQAMLYASLAASLFSALLAMLGKQWLNRYASIDMRGSVIERSQNRQRKLNGIVAWYFDPVIESLPLMLQFALFLLGCALSRYLSEVDTTVASVVLGLTSFGFASYAFFVIAGAASASCPYQTAGANTLRRVLPLVLSTLRSAYSHSEVVAGVINWWHGGIKNFERSIEHVFKVSQLPILILINLAIDAYGLARAMVKMFVAHALALRGRLHRMRRPDPQMATWDLRCMSWMLQTSLDKTIHLLTLELLGMMTMLGNFDPTLVPACFGIFTGCVSISGDNAVILQGSEELVAISTACFLRTLSHLITVDPASIVFKDMRQRYTETFPIETDFKGLQSYHRLCIIHNIFYPSKKLVLYQGFPHPTRRPKIQWGYCHDLLSAEHAILIRLAGFEYQRKQRQKVPRWILRSVYCLLSEHPLPPASAVINYLSIVAMDLGCTVSNTATLDERYIYI